MSKLKRVLTELQKNQRTGVFSKSVITVDDGISKTAKSSNTENLLDCASNVYLKVDREQLLSHGLQAPDEFTETVSEQFRRIKRPIINQAFGAGKLDVDNANVIMIASAMAGSGKSFCATNLARSIAREKDLGAVLVDADVLKPNISRAFDLENGLGLTDFLSNPKIGLDDVLISTDFCGTVVVPAGQCDEDATELLASRRMASFISSLSKRFEDRIVIVDTPPLLMTNEARVLSDNMGQIVLVVEVGVSTESSLEESIATLNSTKPINVILNKSIGFATSDYGRMAYGYNSKPR